LRLCFDIIVLVTSEHIPTRPPDHPTTRQPDNPTAPDAATLLHSERQGQEDGQRLLEGACTCVAVCGGMYVSTPRHLDTSTPRHSPTHPDTPTPRHSDTPTLLDTRRALPLSRSPDTGPDRGRHLRHQCQPTLARHWPDTARHPSTPSTLRHTRAQVVSGLNGVSSRTIAD